jgi:16S rRNA (cytidine1402-2'-O)-methyltransferase
MAMKWVPCQRSRINDSGVGPAVSEAALDRGLAVQLLTLAIRDASAVAAKNGLPRRQIYARALALAGAQR